ncbi:hypothetical protein GQ43DRAFT_390576 [Delitschia confertaspora ATCC 74209]|uniref:Uncharacterized protein n=1 Tax=Delitschia confertaspora ATCC 74209 TaxID=1513339 RepID=A0A9P4JRQ5_9PLEO|nr:hypothetical protein GQ43DRAFT_390576 [Delitschia confertaspora ATCC 74209]
MNMFTNTLVRTARCVQSATRAPTLFLRGSRNVSTLPENSNIYIFPDPKSPKSSLLTLLPTSPPTPSLAIGTTTSLPPTPDTFTENKNFLGILQSVFHTYAVHDPSLKQQAAAFASPGGFNLGGRNTRSGGAGPASSQGGMGGANKGGWIHVSDTRNPPDWGRIAWPEDIFGSLEVDGTGGFVGEGGGYQASGTYRVVTREGILGIPPFLREKLVERLKELEKQIQQKQ